MKCFKCKAKIGEAIRHCINGKFHDLCTPCYTKIMGVEGYALTNGIWAKKSTEPSRQQLVKREVGKHKLVYDTKTHTMITIDPTLYSRGRADALREAVGKIDGMLWPNNDAQEHNIVLRKVIAAIESLAKK